MCHVLLKTNVIVFPKPARQNFTSQAEFCKPKLLPWQSREVWSRAKSDSRIPACLLVRALSMYAPAGVIWVITHKCHGSRHKSYAICITLWCVYLSPNLPGLEGVSRARPDRRLAERGAVVDDVVRKVPEKVRDAGKEAETRGLLKSILDISKWASKMRQLAVQNAKEKGE
jgi:hypothetical protein